MRSRLTVNRLRRSSDIVNCLRVRASGAELVLAPQQLGARGVAVVWSAFFGVRPRHPAMVRLVQQALAAIEARKNKSGVGVRHMAPLLRARHALWLRTGETAYKQTASLARRGPVAYECPRGAA